MSAINLVRANLRCLCIICSLGQVKFSWNKYIMAFYTVCYRDVSNGQADDIYSQLAAEELIFKNLKLFFCVSLRYEMLGKFHLICMKTEGFHAKIRCNLNNISYLSETQKNNF